MKRLTETEILGILEKHEGAHGALPQSFHKVDSCRGCEAPLIPYIQSGRIVHACFDCDAPTAPR